MPPSRPKKASPKTSTKPLSKPKGKGAPRLPTMPGSRPTLSAKTTAAEAPTLPEVPPTPLPEPDGKSRPICWIELVKSGSMFIARSATHGGAQKEYKNRVLEDMLTELIVELQEEIQE